MKRKIVKLKNIVCIAIILFFVLDNWGLYIYSFFKKNTFTKIGLCRPHEYVLFKTEKDLFVAFNIFNHEQSFFISKLQKEFKSEKIIEEFCKSKRFPYIKLKVKNDVVFWIKVYSLPSWKSKKILWTESFYIPSKGFEIGGFDSLDNQLEIIIELLGGQKSDIKILKTCFSHTINQSKQ